MFQKSFIAVALILGIATSVQAENGNLYFQLKQREVKEVTEQFPEFQANSVSSFADCDQSSNVDPFAQENAQGKNVNPLNALEIFVDQIINIGQKIWGIIDAGRPVVNVNLAMANALPRGLSCWADLENWSVPQSKVYQVSYENGFGSEVVTFNYRITFVGGGSYNGVGKYITNAQIVPATLDVGWGFTFNAQAEVPAVFNMGSKADPLAGMQMMMKWSVDTALQHVRESDSYHISGDNTLMRMK